MHRATGKLVGATAEQLMRSRYSAYVLGLTSYLVDTTDPKSRGKNLCSSIEESLQTTCWTSLKIVQTRQGKAEDKVGKVEFIAQFEEASPRGLHKGALHELSRFKRYRGHWVYVDGQILSNTD